MAQWYQISAKVSLYNTPVWCLSSTSVTTSETSVKYKISIDHHSSSHRLKQSVEGIRLESEEGIRLESV